MRLFTGISPVMVKIWKVRINLTIIIKEILTSRHCRKDWPPDGMNAPFIPCVSGFPYQWLPTKMSNMTSKPYKRKAQAQVRPVSS